MNQSAMPANNGDILYPTRVMLFITLLCMGYELSRSITAERTEIELLIPHTSGFSGSEYAALPEWQRQASGKAIDQYAASQEKKWRRWNEAMYERTG